MKWLCKIRHNWNYSTMKVNLERGHISIHRRLCQRCGKCQKQSLETTKWFDTKLTQDEKRELNLKKLGI